MNSKIKRNPSNKLEYGPYQDLNDDMEASRKNQRSQQALQIDMQNSNV